MKNKHILIIAFIFSSFRASSINLKEAIATNLVALVVTGSNYGSMPQALQSGYAPEMQMTLANLSNQDVELSLDPGYLFEAIEPGHQPMLLVQTLDYRLKPNESQLQFVYAMCTALSKAGPGTSLKFRVADKASPALVQLAQFIATKKYQLGAAQQAVWSISDNMPVFSIWDSSIVVRTDLRRQVAGIKGFNADSLINDYKKQDEIDAMNQHIDDSLNRQFNTQRVRYQSRRNDDLFTYNTDRQDRNLTFTVQDTAIVTVGYYDLGGQMIKRIFVNWLFRDGKHSVRYDPYPLSLRGQDYAVKLVKDGQVVKEYYYTQ